MIRAALTAACLASPALACDLGGSYAEANRTLHGAEVTLRNNLAYAAGKGAQCVFAMPPHGAITVIWTHAQGEFPDHAIIIPPPGFMAVPPEASIDEGQTITVLIVPEVIG